MESLSSQQTAAASVKAGRRTVTPGILPAASATIISAVLCFTWLMSDVAMTTPSDNGLVSSELAPVEAQDVEGALATLQGPPAFRAQFRQRAGGCPRPLASLVISTAAGQTVGTVRVRSGDYFSPEFKISQAPVRIAIPYPAAYETGHGVLTVLHSGGDANVALTPSWRVTAQIVTLSHEVTWQPSQQCKQPNG